MDSTSFSTFTSNSTSTSLETLQRSLEDLCLRNGNHEMYEPVTVHHQTPSQVNRVSSSLSYNGSLTGVLPGPGLSNNKERFLGSSSFGLIDYNKGLGNYQPYGFPENMSERTLNAYENSFGEPYVNLCSGFYGNPSGGNQWRNNGFNINNGFVSRRGNGIIVMAAMSEDNSRDLQELLLLEDSRITESIFEGVIEHIYLLMTDRCGCHVFKKLIVSADVNQLRRIVGKLTVSGEDRIYQVSIHRFGCYSMKKLIKVLEKSPLAIEIVKALSNNFEKLMLNSTGQYVIKECLDIVDSQKNDLLFKEAIRSCLKLAVTKQGCASLNSIIPRIKGPRRDQLLNHICDNVQFLGQDPWGNFVAQYVLGLQNPDLVEKICTNLKGYYATISTQKGGSHLVEKCLRSTGMAHVVNDLLQSNLLSQVVKDQYGNYVLQTALKETKKKYPGLYERLVMKLRQHPKSLQHGFGRNILGLINDVKTIAVPLNKAD